MICVAYVGRRQKQYNTLRTMECETLASSEYRDQHDNVAKILHNVLAKHYNLADKIQMYFE